MSPEAAYTRRIRAVLYTVPSAPHVGRLEFSNPRRESGYFVITGTLESDGEEWSVDVEMIGVFKSDMLGFFSDMARHAHSWSGEMSWEAEFAVMRLDVRNPGSGEASIDVTICWPPEYGAEQRGSLVVRADGFPRAYEAMRRLLGIEDGERLFSRSGRREPTWRPLKA
jgi:hypothetical protein